MKALNAFKLNIFNILCFMCKCKQNLNPVFCNIFTHRTKTKYALQNKNYIQERYVEQILVSIAFHTMDPTLEQNSNFKKFNFQCSDSVQPFKCQLKRFFLSVELSHLGILE